MASQLPKGHTTAELAPAKSCSAILSRPTTAHACTPASRSRVPMLRYVVLIILGIKLGPPLMQPLQVMRMLIS